MIFSLLRPTIIIFGCSPDPGYAGGKKPDCPGPDDRYNIPRFSFSPALVHGWLQWPAHTEGSGVIIHVIGSD